MPQLKYWNGSAWVNALIGAQGTTGTQGTQGAQGVQGTAGVDPTVTVLLFGGM